MLDSTLKQWRNLILSLNYRDIQFYIPSSSIGQVNVILGSRSCYLRKARARTISAIETRLRSPPETPRSVSFPTEFSEQISFTESSSGDRRQRTFSIESVT
jgi:hypothetical protein